MATLGEFRCEADLRFALEMVILNRNKNGATLSEIREDFKNFFDIDCESIWGYKCMEQYFKPMLWSAGLDINAKIENDGCILYFADIKAAIRKLSSTLTEGQTQILEDLNIDLEKYLEKLKKIRKNADAGSPSFLTNNNSTVKNDPPKETENIQHKPEKQSTSSVPQDCTVCGHILIGDNFFLEIARIELRRQYTRTRLKQVGQCISGQSLKRALKNVSRAIDNFHRDAAVINLGSVDLLQGREVIDMMQDMYQLCNLLCENGVFPIVTTIPPLANQLHNPNLENKRKVFNEFLMAKFDCINIEDVFYTNCNRVMFNQYQSDARRVGGTRCPLVLWSNVARQRVLKKLRRKIPQIYGETQ